MAMFTATPGSFTGTLSSGSQFLAPDGIVGAPSLSFSAHPTYGFFQDAAQGTCYSFNGTASLSFRNLYTIFDPGGVYAWNATNAVTAGADTGISRSGAGVVCIGTGAPNSTAGTLKASTLVATGANGETWTKGSASELLTIAAAATTDTSANLLPANSIIEAVVCRVTTVIPTAATFTIGDATTAARFATGIAVAATTTAVGLTHVDQTGAGGPKQTAAAKVRITPNLTPGAATGVVRITVFYRQFVAPTS